MVCYAFFFFSFFHLCVCERKRERFAMNLLKGMLMMLLYSFIVKMIIDINARHGVLRSSLNVFDQMVYLESRVQNL